MYIGKPETFFMSRVPMKARGCPASWTGKREYPLRRLDIGMS
jgi:hypothetical protein